MAWSYFLIIIALVIVLFIFVKRPMYEVMFVAFISLCLITGNASNVGEYWVSASRSYLPFTLTGFVIFAVIFEKTGIIQDIIDIIVALVGRFHGGAGYVALLATAAMGSFCGTRPGTAVATGTVTIPTMKRTGYSSELAAVVSAAGSTLGPVIPPTAAIPVMYEMLNAVMPGRYSGSQFWMFAWPICLWLILQRFITLFFVIRKQNVQPVPKEERLSLKLALKKGWRSLLLPIVLFIPFMFGMLCEDGFITDRLGAAAAGHFSSVLLCTVPAIASAFALVLYKQKGNDVTAKDIVDLVGESIVAVAPVIVISFSGYALNEMLQHMGITDSVIASLEAMHLSKFAIVILGPLFFTIMGMFIETSTLYLIFGPVFIPLAIAAGVNPLIAAMSVNIMTNAMGQLTPPFALCLLVSIGIADADFKETSKQAVVWCAAQFVVIVLYLLGWLPMFGMAV